MWSLRKSSFLPFPHGVMAYLIGGQAACFLTIEGLIRSKFLSIYSSFTFMNKFLEICLLTFGLFLLVFLLSPRIRVDILKSARAIEIKDGAIILIILTLYLHLASFSAAVNWNLVWHNSQYLLMSNPAILNRAGGLPNLLLSMNKFAGLLSWGLLSYLIVSGRGKLSIIVAPIAMAYLFYQLGAHSRYSAAYVTVFSVIVSLRPRGRFFAILGAGIALMMLLGSLTGRSSGNHGLSSIPLFLNDLGRLNSNDIGFLLINVFEGFFVSSEVLRLSHNYETVYKFLSLSPTLSFMDGFNVLRPQMEMRLNPLVPISALTEVKLFGPGFLLYYFSLLILATHLSNRLLTLKQDAAAIALNAVVFMIWFLQFTYPTRTMSRFIYLVIFVSLLLLVRRVQDGPRGVR